MTSKIFFTIGVTIGMIGLVFAILTDFSNQSLSLLLTGIFIMLQVIGWIILDCKI